MADVGDERGGAAQQPGFAIFYVTPEMMTTASHNSCEDVTMLTDERPRGPPVCMSASQGLSILGRTACCGPVLIRILQLCFLFCLILCALSA